MMVKMIVTARVPTIGGIHLTKEFTTCRGVRLGLQAVQRGRGSTYYIVGRAAAQHHTAQEVGYSGGREAFILYWES